MRLLYYTPPLFLILAAPFFSPFRFVFASALLSALLPALIQWAKNPIYFSSIEEGCVPPGGISFLFIFFIFFVIKVTLCQTHSVTRCSKRQPECIYSKQEGKMMGKEWREGGQWEANDVRRKRKIWSKERENRTGGCRGGKSTEAYMYSSCQSSRSSRRQ